MKIFAALACSLALSSSCGVRFTALKGSGTVVEEARDVAPFDSVRVEGSINLILSRGEAGPLRIKVEDNLAPLVVATVEGSELLLKTTGSYTTKVGINVYATTADLRSIKSSGSTDVLCQGRVEVDELELEASGASDIECAVNSGSLTVVAQGSSDVRISGAVDLLQVVAEGSSDVAAFELLAAEADVKASGSSDIYVNAKVLRAHASGSSDVRYRGLPEKLSASDRGSGSVSPEGT